MNSKAAKLISKARTLLIVNEPFFGTLALKLQPTERMDIPRMATDGERLFYNPEWVEKASMNGIANMLSTVAEGVVKVANGHTWRKGIRQNMRWDIASTASVLNILRGSGFIIPDDTPKFLLQEEFKGKSAEWIYNQLPDMPEMQIEITISNAGQGEGEDEQESEGKGKGKGKGKQQGTGSGFQPRVQIISTPAGRSQELEEDWKLAVVQAAMAAKSQGNLPAGMEMLLDEIRKPKIDWKAALRRFVQAMVRNDYSWRKPEPRYLPLGIYLPSMVSEGMIGEVVIGVDASGSVWDKKTQEEFGAEMNSIMEESKPERVHVIYFDAKVQSVKTYERGEEIQIKPKGGGGTDFRCIFTWMKKNDITPCCLIVLTDLMGDFPKHAPEFPVLWATIYDGIAPFGEVIRIQEDE